MVEGSLDIKLQRAILGVNDNPEYLGFWPVAARAWRRIVGIEPTLAVIGNASVDESLGTVVRFPSIEGVSTALHSQVIRLLLPALFPGDVCLTTDIDMLPLSGLYFRASLWGRASDRFVVYRDRAYTPGAKKYPMCYLAAQGRTFSEVFGIETLGQIEERVVQWSRCGEGWHTDERMLFESLKTWPAARTRLLRLEHRTRLRVDRNSWRFSRAQARPGLYLDAHLPRPFEEAREQINRMRQFFRILLVGLVLSYATRLPSGIRNARAHRGYGDETWRSSQTVSAARERSGQRVWSNRADALRYLMPGHVGFLPLLFDGHARPPAPNRQFEAEMAALRKTICMQGGVVVLFDDGWDFQPSADILCAI